MTKDAKIIIAYSDAKNTSELVKKIIQDYNLKVVACLNTGEKVLSLVKLYKPDFLVIDASLTGVNCLDILKEVTSSDDVPFIIIYCEEQNDIYWQLAYRYKADLILKKPVDPEYLLKQIQKAIIYGIKSNISILDYQPSILELEKEATIILHSIGLPAKLKGFHYLRIAMLLVAQDSEKLFSFTKILYPQIGEKFGVTGRSVEHSITTAIKAVWRVEKIEMIKKILGCNLQNNGFPTNVEFISWLSDAIRIRMI